MASRFLSQNFYEVLKDETRFTIFIYLIVYRKLTLLELSKYLNKGKTTIHHHIRKLEEAGIVVWEESKEDKKKLKTRHYSVNKNNLYKYKDLTQDKIELFQLSTEESHALKNLLYELMRTEALSTTNLINWMTQFTEEKVNIMDLPTLNERSSSFIKTFPLTDETLPIYKEFERKMSEALQSMKSKQQSSDKIPHITQIGTLMLVPIAEIIEWLEEKAERR